MFGRRKKKIFNLVVDTFLKSTNIIAWDKIQIISEIKPLECWFLISSLNFQALAVCLKIDLSSNCSNRNTPGYPGWPLLDHLERCNRAQMKDIAKCGQFCFITIEIKDTFTNEKTDFSIFYLKKTAVNFSQKFYKTPKNFRENERRFF